MTTVSMHTKRQLPWEQLGVEIPDVATAAEAMKIAELDWTVSKRQLGYRSAAGSHYIKIPDRYAIVRDSDDQWLGTVGSHYVEFQNRDAFTFFDNLVDSGEAKYINAGQQRKGAVIFLVAKLPEGVAIGGEDPHDLYLLLRTSHDGSKAISVYVTPIRVMCTNVLSLATYGVNVKQKWSVQHVSTIQGRLQEARDTLKLTFKYSDEFKKLGDKLLKTKITEDKVELLLDQVIPNRPRKPKIVDQIKSIYNESPTVGYQGTAWGALNAISEYFDHHRSTRSPEAIFTSVIDGQGAIIRNRAAALLLTA